MKQMNLHCRAGKKMGGNKWHHLLPRNCLPAFFTPLAALLVALHAAEAAPSLAVADDSSVDRALADPSAAHLAKPTPGQLEWADMELEMFLCLDPCTWQGREYDNHSTPLTEMKLSKLDVGQWCEAAKSFGAKQIVLVCKHTGGFCWWPTETTDYCVRNIPWKAGKSNLVKEVADACRKHGLQMGIYIYSDDVRYTKAIGKGGRTDDPSKQEEWNAKLRQQWTEVLTLCGPDLIHEVWFDGGCIVPLQDIIEKLAPKAQIFGGPHATVRWPGTESGKLPYPCWSSIGAGVNSDGESAGNPDGPRWCPPECDTVLYGRGGHNWFWSPRNESRRHTLAELMDIYLKSVGRSGVLLLNSSPNTDGRIPVADMDAYAAFGAEIQRRFGQPLGQTNGVGDALELDLSGAKKVNQTWIMEDTRGGHRIRGYALEGRAATGQWQLLAQGSSVGHKRIEIFQEATLDRLRLRITKSVGTPIVRDFAAFYADGIEAVALTHALTEGKPASNSCGRWDKDATAVKFDLTPHIKIPATYEISFVPVAGQIKVRSAKLLFNGAEMPAEDCVIKNGKLLIRQTQQVTGQTRTELNVQFEAGAPAGEATIRMSSE